MNSGQSVRRRRGETKLPRLRLALYSVDHVCRELAKLYREGRAGVRDIGDVSKLANILQILGRLLEASQFEARIAEMEKQLQRQDSTQGVSVND